LQCAIGVGTSDYKSSAILRGIANPALVGSPSGLSLPDELFVVYHWEAVQHLVKNSDVF
jgi:hypothetical protein